MPIIGTRASHGTSSRFKSVVTGGSLSSDATYYYRTFTGNGTLTVSESALTCDVLIGAGGGSGGGAGSGSASGGGSFTSGYVAAVGSYNFVIGAVQNNSTGIGITAYAGGTAQSGYGNGNSGGSGSGAGNSEGGAASGGAATKASGGTITYGNVGGNSATASGPGYAFSGSGGGGGWGGAGGQNYAIGPTFDKLGVGGNAGSGTTAYNSWSQATGIGQLSGGVYYIGAGAAGNSQSVGNAALGLGANSSGYDGSGFVMVRYLKTAV